MKTRILLATSLAANVVLLGAEVYLLKQDVGDLDTPPPLVICMGHAGAGLADSEAVTNRFRRENWRRIESENYAEYVARLRALGCPEKTVCEIVTADVNQMFRRRAEKDVYTATRFGP